MGGRRSVRGEEARDGESEGGERMEARVRGRGLRGGGRTKGREKERNGMRKKYSEMMGSKARIVRESMTEGNMRARDAKEREQKTKSLALRVLGIGDTVSE